MRHARKGNEFGIVHNVMLLVLGVFVAGIVGFAGYRVYQTNTIDAQAASVENISDVANVTARPCTMTRKGTTWVRTHITNKTDDKIYVGVAVGASAAQPTKIGKEKSVTIQTKVVGANDQLVTSSFGTSPNKGGPLWTKDYTVIQLPLCSGSAQPTVPEPVVKNPFTSTAWTTLATYKEAQYQACKVEKNDAALGKLWNVYLRLTNNNTLPEDTIYATFEVLRATPPLSGYSVITTTPFNVAPNSTEEKIAVVAREGLTYGSEVIEDRFRGIIGANNVGGGFNYSDVFTETGSMANVVACVY